MQVETLIFNKSYSQNAALLEAKKKANSLEKKGILVYDYGTKMIQDVIIRPEGTFDVFGKELKASTFSEVQYQSWVTYLEESTEEE